MEEKYGDMENLLREKALVSRDFRNADKQNNLMGFIKGLHSGRVGNTNLSVFLDIVAIALIILTTTGIILSIKRLKAQKRRNDAKEN